MTTRKARVEARKAELVRAAREFKTSGAYKKMRAGTGMRPSGSEEQFTEGVYGSKHGVGSNNCYAFAVDWYRDGGRRKLQPGELSGTAANVDATQCPNLMRLAMADLNAKGVSRGVNRGRAVGGHSVGGHSVGGHSVGGYVVDPDVRCKKGYYKVMGVADPGQDYHWYRQMGDMVVRAPGGRSLRDLAGNMSVDVDQLVSPSDTPGKDDLVAVTSAGLWAHKRGRAELTVKDASGRYITDPRKADRNYGSLNYTDFCGALCVNKDFGVGK